MSARLPPSTDVPVPARLTISDLPSSPPQAWPAPQPSLPSAGWYGDPWGHAALRWWDGGQWSAYVASPVSPPTPTEPPPPTFAVRDGFLVLLVLAVSLAVEHAVSPVLQRADWPLLVVLAVRVLLAYGPVLWASAVVARRHDTQQGGIRQVLAVRFRGSDIGWGALAWLVIVFGNIALHVLFRAVGLPFSSNVRGSGNGALPRSLLVASTLVAVVAAPLIEEVAFRGVVLRAFRAAMPAPLAIALQGVCFGLAHVQVVFGAGNIGLVVVLSWAGVCLGFLAHHFRRLGPSICAHAAVNGVVFLVIWLAPEVLRRAG